MILGGIGVDLDSGLFVEGIAVQVPCIGTANHRNHSPRLTLFSFADLLASSVSPRWKLLVKFLAELCLRRLSRSYIRAREKGAT